MKYCNTCGATIKDEARKCPNCKTRFDKKIDYDAKFNSNKSYDDFTTQKVTPFKKKAYPMPEEELVIPQVKQKGIALVLGFVLPGTGLIYAGNWKKGLTILGSFFLLTTVDLVIKLGFQVWTLFFISVIGYPALIIWSMVSTNKHFKNYSTRGTKKGKWSDIAAVNYDDFSTHQINPKKQKAPSEKFQDFTIPTRKSKGLAIALSIIPPGIGLMYLGKWKKGFILLIAFLLIVTLDVFIKAVWELWSLIGITIVGYLTTIIWSIVSTNNHFKNYSKPSAKYAKT